MPVSCDAYYANSNFREKGEVLNFLVELYFINQLVS